MYNYGCSSPGEHSSLRCSVVVLQRGFWPRVLLPDYSWYHMELKSLKDPYEPEPFWLKAWTECSQLWSWHSQRPKEPLRLLGPAGYQTRVGLHTGPLEAFVAMDTMGSPKRPRIRPNAATLSAPWQALPKTALSSGWHACMPRGCCCSALSIGVQTQVCAIAALEERTAVIRSPLIHAILDSLIRM